MTAGVLAVLARPRLWGVGFSQLFRLARRGWWRRWPPVPRPDPDYLRFRMQTYYGDPDRPFDAADLVRYLEWCRQQRRGLR